MDTQRFDNIIKSKLDKLSPEPDPRSWDLFVLTALEQGENDLFEDTSTDELIKKRLDDYKIVYDQGSWDALEKKLERNPAEDYLHSKKFDRTISNSLHDFRKKYDPSTWPRLAARIEAEEKYLRHYYRAKIVEAALFCLLIITVFQFIGFGQLNNINNSEEIAEIKDSKTGSNSGINSVAPPGSSEILLSGNNSKIFSDSKNTAHKSVMPQRNQAGMIASRPLNSVGIFNKMASINDINFNGIEKLPNKLLLIPFLERSLSVIKETSKVWPEDLVALPQPLEEMIDQSQGLDLPAELKIKVAGIWKFGAYTHADFNQINLPDQSIDLNGTSIPYEAKKVNSIGYGMGFKTLFTNKNLGFETGIGYISKSYAPDRKYPLDQYWDVTFKNINYDIVQIPLSVRFSADKKNRITPYIHAGASANIIAVANYDVIPIKNASFASVNSPNSGFNNAKGIETERISKQFLKDYKNYKKNSFIGVHTAVGMEYQLTHKLDIYSQVSFNQRIINKIGPNRDDIKSLSLEFGLRTRI